MTAVLCMAGHQRGAQQWFDHPGLHLPAGELLVPTGAQDPTNAFVQGRCVPVRTHSARWRCKSVLFGSSWFTGTTAGASSQGRVVSGHTAALDVVQEAAVKKGALKAARLAVSGAFHTPLMQPARDALVKVPPLVSQPPCG